MQKENEPEQGVCDNQLQRQKLLSLLPFMPIGIRERPGEVYKWQGVKNYS
jgi:hypothetical protein